jgi:hypothetical protein
MAIEDIKENLREQVKAVMGRVRETDLYLRLSEKYQSLSPAGQKVSIAGAVLVAFLIVMAIPWSFYSGSQTMVEEYEGKRNTVRELFKVNRETAALPIPAPPVTATDLTAMAKQSLTTARLAPDQIVGVNEMPANVSGISKSIDQAGIEVSLAKLNLKQIVDIGSDLQNLQGPSGTARMMGLEVKANMSDARYYDAIYKIVAFSAKPDAAAAGKGGKPKGRKK